MDLYFNSRAAFTRWAVRSGALRAPFVLVDVGVQGGENIRWHLLEDHLVVYGLDPIEEVVEELRRQNAGRANRHYLAIAAGSSDEERLLQFNAADPCSSSLYAQGDDRFGSSDQRRDRGRLVPVRRLDTLLAEGAIRQPDFLKVDVEGFEKEVLLGAPTLLAAGLLGIEMESNFSFSPAYPQTHFGTLQDLLRRHHFFVFDVNYNRVPRASFRDILERKGLGYAVADAGRPATLNVLFSRDLIAETDTPGMYPFLPPPATDEQAILKAMIICELHGLNDVAADTALRFRDLLGSRIDVDKAIALLADPRGLPPGTYGWELEIQFLREQLDEIVRSTSWRMTAPLRAAVDQVKRRVSGAGRPRAAAARSKAAAEG